MQFCCIMKKRHKLIYTLIQKSCAFLLLFAFTFIAFAQYIHAHSNHNHTASTHQHHSTKHQISEKEGNTCQICQFNLNQNNGQILSSVASFNFSPNLITQLLQTNYVAFYSQKHLSLFSGNSPPIA